MLNNNQVLLHLSLIEDIGPTTVGLLLSRLPDGFELSNLYTFSIQQFMQTFGLSAAKSVKIVQGLADEGLLDQELARIERYNISWCTILDEEYPQQLTSIIGPPVVIYYKGLPVGQRSKCLAVIGSRKANNYAKKFIESIVPPLVHQGWTIVSGGALGADTMAHQATVNAGGATVVVLGSGILHPYPSSNKKLFDAVVATGGTVISIFPAAMQAMPGNFPARNRIISGLSRGCIVAQAAKKSGASITAHYALDQGRDVFAVPGPLDDELSAGCHALIQQGAKLTTCVEDILQEYGELVVHSGAQQLAIYKQPIGQGLVGVAATVVTACAQPATVDDLLESTGLNLPELNALLFELQLSGHLEQDFAGQWKQV